MYREKTFHFNAELLNKKIEKVYPYRTAFIPMCMIDIRGEDMLNEVEKLFKRSEKKLDNHIVFKIESCPLYFWFTDNELRIGTEVVEARW